MQVMRIPGECVWPALLPIQPENHHMNAPYHPNRTIVGATETLAGLIPHLQIVYAGGVLPAPVKLVVKIHDNHGRCEPQRRGDKLVYALPGGGEIERTAS